LLAVDGFQKTHQEKGMIIFDFITRADPSAIAIAAPERAPMTYEGLAALVEKTLRSLNRAGLGRTDKVAIVLPNGPLIPPPVSLLRSIPPSARTSSTIIWKT
jgi:non-ribosomal peptide synthetase component E (peptide arylation enzyme)